MSNYSRFNFLLNPLPKRINVGDKVFEIDTSFRVGIQFQFIMEDKSSSAIQKVLDSCRLFFGNQSIPDYLLLEVMKSIIDYYSCYPSHDVGGKKSSREDNSQTKSIYSFKYDSGYIFSSFMQAYHIDLTNEDMHWFKFQTLLRNLPSDTIFSTILGYRAKRITSDMPDEHKRFYKEMKQFYSLPDDRTETEKAEDFVNALPF